MQSIKRRDFIKQAGCLVAGFSGPGLITGKWGRVMAQHGITVTIPMPVQLVIDDVGWWSGEDGSARQEPYRTGINRNHVPADYQAIVDLGKKLGIRPQAATILCEWDRYNILRKLPTSTWMGEKWDNTKWIGPWLDQAADIIRNNQQHYELTLHGVGHEYWMSDHITRAEWADRSGQMRPLDQVELHLDYFGLLMEQNRLGSFPSSFVPTAFLHGFGPTGDHRISCAEVLKKRGITYINTPFYDMYNAKAVQYRLFGIDTGVMTVDRGQDLAEWNVIGSIPEGKLSGPTCGLHWPNLLHADPVRNTEVVDGWVKFLTPYNSGFETILAPDSTFFQQQLLHYICTTAQIKGKFIELDFSSTRSLPTRLANNQLILKIQYTSRMKFRTEAIKLISDSYIKDNDTYRYTLLLERMPGKWTSRIEYTELG